MIYVTGDCHSDFSKFSEENFPIQKEMTKNDYVIICGDFGGIWNYKEESPEEKEKLDKLNSKNFTTLFIDGNHENFDRLYSYEQTTFNGGKVHKIRDSIYHLMRGEVFNIDGKTIFAFGGATSHDIDDGILEMDDKEGIEIYRRIYAKFRINHYSWWEEELPSDLELKNGIANLKNLNYKVDVILTHCAPTSIAFLIGGAEYKKDILTEYLQEISIKCNFEKWYFGHYHKDRQIDLNYTALYEKIIPLI